LRSPVCSNQETHAEVNGATAALYYMMDSAGQKTTIIYNGLRSFADIQPYWQRRGELVRW
jgi:hypothetical protein